MALDGRVRLNLEAVDSTFPSQLRNMIEDISLKIEEHRDRQYAANINTAQEGTYDESLEVGDLFNSEIACLEDYVQRQNSGG